MKTTRLLIVGAAALLLLAGPAAASGDTEIDCNGNGSCATTNNSTTNNTTQNVNSATGGTGVGIGVGKGGDGGNATIERGAVKVDNKNTNLQKQKQSQSQAAIAGSYSESEVKNSGNSDVAINYERNTASAYAAPGAIGNNICRSGIGAGGQGPAIGLSFNFANLDEGCEARTNAQVLLNTANYFQKTGDRAKAAQYYAASDREICSIDSIREKNGGPGELCGPVVVAQAPSEPTVVYQPMRPVTE